MWCLYLPVATLRDPYPAVTAVAWQTPAVWNLVDLVVDCDLSISDDSCLSGPTTYQINHVTFTLVNSSEFC